MEYSKNGISLIKFRDEILLANMFIRIFDNKKYYFQDNSQILFSKENKTKFITKVEKSKKLTNNFITLDIETFVKDNILIPYCISIFDGKICSSFYFTDFINVDDMITSALK